MGVCVPAQKGKSRAAGAKSKVDKSRTPVRAQSKKTPKTPGRTPSQRSPSPDEAPLPQEPLDVEPILDDLLDRVLTECALAAAARQVRPPRPVIWGGLGGLGVAGGALSAVSAASAIHGVAGAGRYPVCR